MLMFIANNELIMSQTRCYTLPINGRKITPSANSPQMIFLCYWVCLPYDSTYNCYDANLLASDD